MEKLTSKQNNVLDYLKQLESKKKEVEKSNEGNH